MKKYIRMAVLFLVVCLTLTLASTGGVSGRTEADINEEIRQAEERAARLEAENKAREGQIIDMQGDRSKLEAYKALIEQNVTGVTARMNELNGIIDLQWEAIYAKQAEIVRLEERIADAEAEVLLREDKIEKLEAENKENLKKFGQIVKNNYMTGSYSFFDILMDSSDFYDMIVRYMVLQKAAERNTEFMNDLLKTIAEQESEIEELEKLQERLAADIIRCEEDKASLEEELAELYERMKELDVEMAAEQTKLYGYAGEIAELQSAINNMYSRYNATNAEIEELEKLTTELIKQKQNLNMPSFADDGFIWPLDSGFQKITCSYGWDSWRNGWHRAIDVGNAGINGANIYAIQSGVVLKATEGYGGGYGSHVIIDHGGGVASLYAHMIYGSVTVTEGQTIEVGHILGKVGSTGWSTGPHLHFEIHVNGERVNPLEYAYTYYYQ
ncbi:MAG: peptidoglycan DD-metalloendopeptidase family protein [Oscillospiraceae bacterium]|nr:peptidoglycan DD-metalloendopeptidase family protein [Oscillospiraceae bacterium]